MYSSERRDRDLAAADKAEVERLVAKMEAEMKSAAKQLEFERAAALRDEIQQIRLRVLEQDASVVVARAAERAARDAALPAKERAAAHRPGGPGFGADAPAFEVTSVQVLQSGEEPGSDDSTGIAAELFPGIRDEHEDDDGGWQARWLDRPTWDHTVTPEHPPPDRAASVATRARLLTPRVGAGSPTAGTPARSGATRAHPARAAGGARCRSATRGRASACSFEGRIVRGGEWLRRAGFIRVTDRRVLLLLGPVAGRDDVIELPRSLRPRTARRRSSTR